MAPRSPGIDKLPSGRYRWRVEYGGRRRSGVTDTKPEAVAARAKAQLELGATPAIATSMTVDELLELWGATTRQAEATVDVREDALNRLPPAFRRRPVSEVTPQVAAALWRQLEAAGVTPHYVVKIRNALSRAWAEAIELGAARDNPILAAKPRTTPPPPAEVHPPEPATVRLLLDHLEQTGRDGLALWVRTAARIGTRPGELCGLQRADVDKATSQLRIRRGVTRRGSQKTTKTTRSTRSVDLAPDLVKQLLHHDVVVGCPWIFHTDRLDPWRPSGVRVELVRAFDRIDRLAAAAADTAGHERPDPVERFNPYALRHFCATQALARGVPPEEVAAMLGDNVATIHRVYAHWIPTRKTFADRMRSVLDAD
jgi:integrase